MTISRSTFAVSFSTRDRGSLSTAERTTAVRTRCDHRRRDRCATAHYRFDRLAHPHGREDACAQTTRGELATSSHARSCSLKSYATQRSPPRTGATGNGRVGVREKAHHLHVVGSVSYASRGHRCSARGFWRARASFERLRTPDMRPGPRSDAAARASSRFVAMISACCVWRCAPLRLLSTWVVKHGNFSDEYRVLGLRSPRMVHADLTLKL